MAQQMHSVIKAKGECVQLFFWTGSVHTELGQTLP